MGKDPVIDSLVKHAYQASSVEEKAKALEKAIRIAQNGNNKEHIAYAVGIKFNLLKGHYPDSIPAYLKTLKQTTIAAKKPKTNAFYFTSMADVSFSKGAYDEAIENYTKAIAIQKRLKDSIAVAYNLFKAATVQLVYNDYYGSESNATEALSYLEKQKTTDYYLREVYNILGISYTGLRDYPSAEENYSEALKLSTDSLSSAILKNNIAYVHILNSELQTAVQILSELSESDVVINEPSTKARVLDNLGIALFRIDSANGLEQLNEAMLIREKHDTGSLASSYLHLSEYYKSKNPTLALQFANKAYYAAKLANSADDQIEILDMLSNLSNGNSAIQYSRKRISMSDSIVKLRQVKENKFAKLKYDTSVTEARNVKLEKDNEIQGLLIQKRTILFTIALVLILIITFFWRRINKMKHQREKLEESYKTETRIAKKIHDELANDVYFTLSFAGKQDLSVPENKETLLNNLDNIYSRTRDISKENSSIDTGAGFPVQLKDMISGYQSPDVGLFVSGLEIQWNQIAASKKIETYRIVQELLTNMKKHSNCHRAVLSFSLQNNILEVKYSDDGQNDFNNKKNHSGGLQNVENRIRAMNGTITFEKESGKGFKVRFTLPIK